jgi:GGDEF domain-containing protein
LQRLAAAVEAADLAPALVRHLQIHKGRVVPAERTVGVLGREAVAALAVTAMWEPYVTEIDLPPFLRIALWEDAMRTAGAAATMSDAHGREDSAWDGAWAVLMHLSIAELFRARPYAATWLEDVRPLGPLLRGDAERALFGSSRVDALDVVGRVTGLPADLLDVPRQAMGGGAPDDRVLRLRQAEDLAWRVAHRAAREARQSWCAEVGLSQGLTDAEMHRLCNDALVCADRIAAVSHGPAPSVPPGWGPDPVPAIPVDPDAFRSHALRVERELAGATAALRRSEERDAATGLPSLRAGCQEWNRRAVLSRATRRNLWCALIELDALVDLAASEGFGASDRALVSAAAALSSVLRDGFVSRFGDGTLAVFFEADVRGARIAAERMRCAIAEARVQDVGRRVTATIVAGDLLGLDRAAPASDLLHALRRLLVSQDRRASNHVTWLEPVGGVS